MRLLSLEVANYRNIAAAQLEPGRELTVICGNNGQGKTNLLEAIWLLTGGKSFRGGKDAELVRRGETFAVLEAVTQRTRQEDQEPDDPEMCIRDSYYGYYNKFNKIDRSGDCIPTQNSIRTRKTKERIQFEHRM